jgi:Lon protease-like protein
LEGGRLNITAVGGTRFRILSLFDGSSPFLIGEVEPVELIVQDPLQLSSAGAELRKWVERYLSRLNVAGKSSHDPQLLPREPVPLAHTAAALLQAPAIEKQTLLETPEALQLIHRLRGAFRRETALLEPMLAQKEVSDGVFSQN